MTDDWNYPVELRLEEGKFHAYAKDVPEAIASGATVDEALASMKQALIAALSGQIDDGGDLDLPSAAGPAETYRVALPALLAAKASLFQAWRRSGLTKTALAERLGCAEIAVRRILDPEHNSGFAQIEAAAQALGVRLVVTVEAA